MPLPTYDHAQAGLIAPHRIAALEVMGPTIQYVTEPGRDDASPCVLRGTIPPGVIVPLHSHADVETFVAMSGALDALIETDSGFEWTRIVAGDVFHVPGGVKHAFRNATEHPAVSIVMTTSRLGRFFREVGLPPSPGRSWPPSRERVERFLAVAQRYGHWTAGPDDNARVGLALPQAA